MQPPAMITLFAVLLLGLSAHVSLGANSQFPPPFRFDGFPPPEPTRSATSSAESSSDGSPATTASLSSTDSSNDSNRSLIWQPLRATFRPLNRQTSPQPPVPLALSLGTEPISSSESSFSSAGGDSSTSTVGFASDLAPPPPPPNSNGNTFPTPAPSSARNNLDDEDQPTRVPLNRFRPTKAPSSDPQTQPTPLPASDLPPSASFFPLASTTTTTTRNLTSSSLSSSSDNNNNSNKRMGDISSECLECICEASTNCNPNSRCQTSDVRHTRCGMFLISYDQWLETGLSKELVTSDALAQDAAADERAFYECVTNRECAERLLGLYANRHAKDCDKDGRIDCYDMAAVHQGGLDGCQSDALLDSQYWNDFNACYGFGR